MTRVRLSALVSLAVTSFAPGAFAVQSAELYRTATSAYGRFEARMRFAPGDGVVGAFFLWKVGSETPGAFWNELDYEKIGGTCEFQTNAIYGNPSMGSEQRRTMPSGLCDAYHDYRFEWTPTYIAWAIDGQEIRRETGAVATAFAQNAQSGLRFHFNVWPGNNDFGGNFNPNILPVRQYISWAQYSSYQNDTFTVAWREDFNGSSLPSGWATGDWASPFGLSTHNPANVAFVNGIAVLSMTADGATGFNGTPPPDGGAGMGGNGGAGAGGAGTGGAGMGGNGGAGAGGAGAGGMSVGGAGSNQGGSGGMSQAGMAGGGMSMGGAAGNAGMATGGAAGNAGMDAGGAGGNAGMDTGGMGGMSSGGMGAAGVANGAGMSSAGVLNVAGAGNAGVMNGAGMGNAGVTSAGGMGNAGVATMAGAPATGSGGSIGPAPNTPEEPGGCGCGTAPSSRHGFAAMGAALLAIAARRRSRRKRGHLPV
jgi:endo-1,3-1,4-beta-glycanase ExoK